MLECSVKRSESTSSDFLRNRINCQRMQARKRNDPVGAHVLDLEIAAFEKLREELERTHLDQFALSFEGKFVGVYPDSIEPGGLRFRYPKRAVFIQQIGTPVGLIRIQP